jgi:hypothetical protein
MHRKSWEIEDGTECVLCDSHTAKTRDHLFFECAYAKKCWEIVNIVWDCSRPISSRFLHAQGNFSGHCFTEIFVCAMWNIWKDRNDLIFDAQQPRTNKWKVRFRSDLELHKYRIKAHLVQPLLDWIHTCII